MEVTVKALQSLYCWILDQKNWSYYISIEDHWEQEKQSMYSGMEFSLVQSNYSKPLSDCKKCDKKIPTVITSTVISDSLLHFNHFQFRNTTHIKLYI